MSIDTQHHAVVSRAAMWARVRDAIGGGFVLRDTKTAQRYVPMLSGQTLDEYAAYVDRATYLEATARTQEAMTGLVFSRDPAVTLPGAVAYLADDADADGTSAHDVARTIVDELQATGFGALVVSHNGDPNNPGTAANPSGRPYVRWYAAESVINWRHATIGGARVLAQLRLSETVEDVAGEFETESAHQIRVLDLEPYVTDAGTQGARLRERAYRLADTGKAKKKEWVLYGAPAYPMVDGRHVDKLPAKLVSADATGVPCAAPLSPVAEMNLSHWRTSADHEHALHFCGLPTPWVAGVRMGGNGRRRGDTLAAVDGSIVTGRENLQYTRGAPTQSPSLALGSSRFLVFEDAAATCGILTMGTDGIGALEKALDRKERAMAVLGARTLAQESNTQSGVALGIKRSGEQSALVRIANVAGDAIAWALTVATEWAGADSTDVTYALDTSFADAAIDGPTLSTLLAAVNAGKMSRFTFIYNLRRGGYLPDDVSDDDEIERIANDPTVLADPLAAFGNPAPIGGAA